MPRGPRLDTPGALHHVMVRGLDRQVIFRTDEDRKDFVARLGTVCQETGLAVLAWALLPNHVHLLLRTGRRPLATAMRRLLTGYAVTFNRRHHRVGHLFQNRYKSILVEEELYLLELVRYIHLNPLRVGLVRDLAVLERYPWTGHSTLLGRAFRPWQAVGEVLHQYGKGIKGAQRAYRTFVRDGIAQGRRPELQGGGLRRSAGGWEGVATLRRGREDWTADERILGSSVFVARMLREATYETSTGPSAQARTVLPALLQRVARAYGVTVPECCGSSRRRDVVAARAVVSRLAVCELGLPAVTVARALGVSSQTVLAGLNKQEKKLAPRGLDLKGLLAHEKKRK